MKPIEFMDALSDVNEGYIREMLGEAEAPAAAVQRSAITETKSERITGSTKTSGAERPFGSKMRYLVLFASAAACVAFAVGMLNLHHGSEQNSLIADSILSDITEVTETTTLTAETTTEATTATTTVRTTAENAGTSKSQKEDGNGTTAKKAEKPDGGSQTQETTQKTTAGTTANTTAKTTAKTTESSAKSTTAATVTTEETEPESTAPVTTTIFPTRRLITEYTQPYMLGDIDMDGDINLIDYFIARRNWTRWHEDESECEIDYAAFDRGNVDRRCGDENDDSPISLSDATSILDIALMRRWLGRPGTTVPDYLETVDIYNTNFNIDEELVAQFNSLFLFDAGEGYSGNVIIGEQVPKEVRDFYNDAHTIESCPGRYPSYDFRFCWWSQDEFNQKMNELRVILARN